MKNNINYIITAIVICFGVVRGWAQEKTNYTDTLGRKQGHWVKLDQKRKKVYEGNFTNDIPQGKFTYYLENGKPWAIMVFSDNGKVSHAKHLDTEGKVTGEGKYINQEKDSLWKFYDGTGLLRAEESYLNGKKHGNSKVYYANGKISEEKVWVNGKLNGPCTKYFESGVVKSKRNYVNDWVDGPALFNYPNGKQYAVGAYKNDLKEGEWKFYKEDGTVDKKFNFVKGRTAKDADSYSLSKDELEKLKKQYENSDNDNAANGPR